MADDRPMPVNEGLRLFQSMNNRRVLSDFTFKLVLLLSLLNIILWITTITLQIFLLTAMERSSLYVLVCLATCWAILILLATAVSSYGLLPNHPKEVKSFGVIVAITTGMSLLIFIFHVVTLSLDSFDWTEDPHNWTIADSFGIFTSLFVVGGNCIVLRQMIYEWRHFCKEMEHERAEKIQQYLKAEQQIYMNQLQTAGPLDELERKERVELEERLERVEQMELQEGSSFVITAAQFLRAAEDGDDEEEPFSFYPPVFV